MFHHFKRNIPHLVFWFSKAIDLEKHLYIDLAKPKSGAPGPGCSKPN